MVLGNNDSQGNPKKWIHSSDSLVNGRVNYPVKFIGKAEVPEPRGMAMVKMALQKLKFSRQIKRTEGMKPPKVELGINIHAVSISDIKTKEVLHNISLHRVSFCADDKQDKRLFAFIAKLEDDKHYCYGLDSLHQANDITLTIGQAFDLAYERFLKQHPQGKNTAKQSDMSKRIQELEQENLELKQRIAQLESGGKRDVIPKLNTSPKQSAPTNVLRNIAQPSLMPPAGGNVAIPRRSHVQATSSTSYQEQEAINFQDSNDILKSTTNNQALTSSSSSLHSPISSSFQHDGLFGNFPLSTPPCGPLLNKSPSGTFDHDPQNNTNQIHGLSSSLQRISNSVGVPPTKNFFESLQRSQKSKRNPRHEVKPKKTISFLPTKLLSKKLKLKPRGDSKKEALHNFDEPYTSPCSSPSSSQYGNLDDIISTLQKMMSKTETKPKQNGDVLNTSLFQPAAAIGEKLATYHNANQQDYDRLMKPVPGLVTNVDFHPQTDTPRTRMSTISRSENPAYHQMVQVTAQGPTQLEAVHSSEDVSSLSTASRDSSSTSTEHVYMVQPKSSLLDSYETPTIATFRAQTLETCPQKPMEISSKANSLSIKKQNMGYRDLNPSIYNALVPPDGINSKMLANDSITDTLRQLSGEEGYMVLSGRRQVENILFKNNPSFTYPEPNSDDPCFDSTYDNVSRLLEAVREAAAKDASIEERRTNQAMATKAHPQSHRVKSAESQQEAKEFHLPPSQTLRCFTEGSQRAPSTTSMSTDCGSYDVAALCSPVETAHYDPRMKVSHGGQTVLSGLAYHPTLLGMDIARHQTSSPCALGANNEGISDNSLFLRRNLELSQETEIGTTPIPHSAPSIIPFRNEDPFNMQPFVPSQCHAATSFPQPPSRKPQNQQGDIWSDAGMFDPFQTTGFNKTLQDMKISCPPHHTNLSYPPNTQDIENLYPKQKKSNYHIVSHRLINKKRVKEKPTALKWSRKYFPTGRKKQTRKMSSSCCRSRVDNGLPVEDGFSSGLTISGADITLDSFDPLKH